MRFDFTSLRAKSILATLFLCMFLTGCGTLSSFHIDPSEKETIRYASKQDLDAEVKSLVEPVMLEKDIPGLALGVLLSNGEMKFYNYGVASKETLQPIDSDTVFDIGSLSKGFLGLMTAQLIHEGTLSWHTTLQEVFPPGTPLSADAAQITLEQLATHTSGLPRQPYTLQTLGYFIEYLFSGNSFYRHLNLDATLDYLATFQRPSKVVPTYSNIGYGLLGYAIEQRTGQTLEDLLAARIIQPLKLTHTGYRLEKKYDLQNRAYGYAGDQPKFMTRGQPVPDWQFTELMKGSAAMYSNTRDLLKVAKSYLEESENAQSAWADTLQIRFPMEKEAAAIAWVIDSIDQQKIAYQIGMVAGYTSFIGLDTRHRQAVVVLQNSFNWSANIGYQLLVRLGKAQDMGKQLLTTNIQHN